MTKLAVALTRADEMRAKICQLLHGHYSDDRRTTLVLGYTDLALEHHDAISRLMNLKLYGSACALARPVVEALFRALWVNTSATDEQVDQVAENDDFKFPSDMMAVIDEKYSQEDKFFSTIKSECWSPLCGYAHGGLLQLSKRFRDRKVEPNYSEGDLLEVVGATTASIILLGRLLTVATGRAQEAEEMEQLMLAWGASN